MGIRSTHTYALLPVSAAAYDEIHKALTEAGYDHVFMEDGAIDLHGLALTKKEWTNDGE